MSDFNKYMYNFFTKFKFSNKNNLLIVKLPKKTQKFFLKTIIWLPGTGRKSMRYTLLTSYQHFKR